MSGWPTDFARTTKHKKPRYQLYQPGFNEANGCWLDGSWITLPETEWKKKKSKHQKLYAKAAKQRGNQSYHDDGVKPDDMTEAQRQAWEHYSGTNHFDAIWPNGVIGPLGVEMAGNKLTSKSEKWLREQGAKLFKWVANGNKSTHQLKGFDIPKDLISDQGKTKKEAVNTWQNVVDQNVARFDALFYECAEAIEKGDDPGGMEFDMMTVMHRIFEVEEGIIRMEWNVSQGREADEYQTIEGETERYVKLRHRLKEAIFKGGHYEEDDDGYDVSFEKYLAEWRARHNECERANLDNSDGRTGAFVLPKFHDDGTHEPVGERDIPWNWVDPWSYEEDE